MSPNERLSQFVLEAMRAGRTRDEIAEALADAGWPDGAIAGALDAWADRSGLPPVPRPRPPVTAGEAFLHALILVALVVSVANLLTLGFALIDRALPEAGARPQPDGVQSIRWSIAALIVFFPVYLRLSTRARGTAAASPARGKSRVVRWFAHLAIFAAALVLLGDLLSVIYALLNGDLTGRFLAKAALVAVTAGLILTLFRPETREGSTVAAATAAFALLVAGLVLAGLAVAGGPGKGRTERRDETRLQDLSVLSSYAECVAQTRGIGLPETLGIDPDCQWNVRFADPFTGAPYRYERLSETAFRVCAGFEDPAWAGTRRPGDFDGESGCILGRFDPPR